VLPAIEFDYDSMSVTYEIDNERSDWALSAKRQAFEAMTAQCEPEMTFGIGQLAPERLRSL
jgi:hypothetical protein